MVIWLDWSLNVEAHSSPLLHTHTHPSHIFYLIKCTIMQVVPANLGINQRVLNALCPSTHARGGGASACLGDCIIYEPSANATSSPDLPTSPCSLLPQCSCHVHGFFYFPVPTFFSVLTLYPALPSCSCSHPLPLLVAPAYTPCFLHFSRSLPLLLPSASALAPRSRPLLSLPAPAPTFRSLLPLSSLPSLPALALTPCLSLHLLCALTPCSCSLPLRLLLAPAPCSCSPPAQFCLPLLPLPALTLTPCPCSLLCSRSFLCPLSLPFLSALLSPLALALAPCPHPFLLPLCSHPASHVFTPCRCSAWSFLLTGQMERARAVWLWSLLPRRLQSWLATRCKGGFENGTRSASVSSATVSSLLYNIHVF